MPPWLTVLLCLVGIILVLARGVKIVASWAVEGGLSHFETAIIAALFVGLVLVVAVASKAKK
jgi:hypothetical protein